MTLGGACRPAGDGPARRVERRLFFAIFPRWAGAGGETAHGAAHPAVVTTTRRPLTLRGRRRWLAAMSRMRLVCNIVSRLFSLEGVLGTTSVDPCAGQCCGPVRVSSLSAEAYPAPHGLAPT